jgi:hypothetical protein
MEAMKQAPTKESPDFLKEWCYSESRAEDQSCKRFKQKNPVAFFDKRK